MLNKSVAHGIILVLLVGGGLLSGRSEEMPFLSAPQTEDKLSRLAALDIDEMKKEAESLQRKANLLKDAASKKYAEANRLRQQAGATRQQASAQSQALQSRAQSNQDMSNMLGSLFGMIGSMNPMPTPNQSATMGLTGKLFEANQAMDARSAGEAQTAAGQLEMQAEKAAGPLEMKAQIYEDDGNRLMSACNRVQSLANVKFLLIASEELRQAVVSDREFLASAKKRL